MPDLPSNTFVYALYLVMISTVLALTLVVTVLGRLKASVSSIRLFQAYFVLGSISWALHAGRTLGMLPVDHSQSGLGYIAVSMLLLLAIAECAPNRRLTAVLVVLHGVVLYVSTLSSELPHLIRVVSLYAIVVYTAIFVMTARRGVRRGNVGYLLYSAAALLAIGGAAYQLYALQVLEDAMLAYETAFLISVVGFSLVGIGFLTSVLIAEHQQLQAAALGDPLTGLLNRRGMEHAVSGLVSEGRAGKTCVSAIVIDIDHFKKINDTYGHDGGDQVLRGVAQALKDFPRATDVVSRLGGEEFVMVLLDTPIHAAEALAERVRRGIADLSLESGGQRVAVTASLGVASQCGEVRMPELIKAADQALYEAKESGRNRVCVAT